MSQNVKSTSVSACKGWCTDEYGNGGGGRAGDLWGGDDVVVD